MVIKLIEAKKILISVGTKPKKLKQFKELNLISSDEAFDLKSLPKNILILGGGYIAVEFASIFNGLGVNTSLCIRGKRILKDFDSEISEFLMEQMSYKGIKIIRAFLKRLNFKTMNLMYILIEKNPVMIGLWRPLEEFQTLIN